MLLFVINLITAAASAEPPPRPAPIGRFFSRLIEKRSVSPFPNNFNACKTEFSLRFINLENQKYDTGAAVTAINLDDFQPDDDLEIDQMIEPIVMSNEGVLRSGTVVLRKRSA